MIVLWNCALMASTEQLIGSHSWYDLVGVDLNLAELMRGLVNDIIDY